MDDNVRTMFFVKPEGGAGGKDGARDVGKAA